MHAVKVLTTASVCIELSLQAPTYQDGTLECSMPVIHGWSNLTDLTERLRATLRSNLTANAIILPGLGALVLAPGLSSLQRRMEIVEQLILLAAGQPTHRASSADSETQGALSLEIEILLIQCDRTCRCHVC